MSLGICFDETASSLGKIKYLKKDAIIDIFFISHDFSTRIPFIYFPPFPFIYTSKPNKTTHPGMHKKKKRTWKITIFWALLYGQERRVSPASLDSSGRTKRRKLWILLTTNKVNRPSCHVFHMLFADSSQQETDAACYIDHPKDQHLHIHSISGTSHTCPWNKVTENGSE